MTPMPKCECKIYQHKTISKMLGLRLPFYSFVLLHLQVIVMIQFLMRRFMLSKSLWHDRIIFEKA